MDLGISSFISYDYGLAGFIYSLLVSALMMDPQSRSISCVTCSMGQVFGSVFKCRCHALKTMNQRKEQDPWTAEIDMFLISALK